MIHLWLKWILYYEVNKVSRALCAIKESNIPNLKSVGLIVYCVKK